MAALLRGAPVAALVAGCAYLATEKAQTEAQPQSKASWLSWLVHPHHDNETSDVASNYGAAHFPRDDPGSVLAWGGVFGRSPVRLHALGDRITRVAVAHNGVGGAIDSCGAALAFKRGDTGDIAVAHVPLPNGATQVAIREDSGHLVFLDAAGVLHTTRVQADGGDDGSKNGANSGISFAPPSEILLKSVQAQGRAQRVTHVDCGRVHCIALTASGEAFSWGDGKAQGQITGGAKSARSTSSAAQPAQHATAHAMYLPEGMRCPVGAACGDAHSLVVDQGGVVYSCGNDTWTQLAISAEPWHHTHVRDQPTLHRASLVQTLATAHVAAGAHHSCLLVRDGTLFTSGFNQFGQLGHHNYCSFAPPAPIADWSFRSIAVIAGGNHTCVVTDAGHLLCIGANEAGQLGIGSLQPSAKWRKIRIQRKAVKPSFVHAASVTTAAIVASQDADSKDEHEHEHEQV